MLTQSTARNEVTHYGHLLITQRFDGKHCEYMMTDDIWLFRCRISTVTQFLLCKISHKANVTYTVTLWQQWNQQQYTLNISKAIQPNARKFIYTCIYLWATLTTLVVGYRDICRYTYISTAYKAGSSFRLSKVKSVCSNQFVCLCFSVTFFMRCSLD